MTVGAEDRSIVGVNALPMQAVVAEKDLQAAGASDVLDLLETTRLPERLLALGTSSARGARAAAFNDARTAVHALALEELASRDREHSRRVEPPAEEDDGRRR